MKEERNWKLSWILSDTQKIMEKYRALRKMPAEKLPFKLDYKKIQKTLENIKQKEDYQDKDW